MNIEKKGRIMTAKEMLDSYEEKKVIMINPVIKIWGKHKNGIFTSYTYSYNNNTEDLIHDFETQKAPIITDIKLEYDTEEGKHIFFPLAYEL